MWRRVSWQPLILFYKLIDKTNLTAKNAKDAKKIGKKTFALLAFFAVKTEFVSQSGSASLAPSQIKISQHPLRIA